MYMNIRNFSQCKKKWLQKEYGILIILNVFYFLSYIEKKLSRDMPGLALRREEKRMISLQFDS